MEIINGALHLSSSSISFSVLVDHVVVVAVADDDGEEEQTIENKGNHR